MLSISNKPELRNEKAIIFKALSHPTRLYMVEALSNGEKCVCEFVEEVKVDFSTISKHLSILKQAGIIDSEKRGKWVYYRLIFNCITDFMGCLDTTIKSKIGQKAETLNTK